MIILVKFITHVMQLMLRFSVFSVEVLIIIVHLLKVRTVLFFGQYSMLYVTFLRIAYLNKDLEPD